MDIDPVNTTEEAPDDQISDDATFESSSDSQSMDNVTIETGANETVESEPLDQSSMESDAYADDVVVVLNTSADDSSDVKLADVEMTEPTPAAADVDVNFKVERVKIDDVVKIESGKMSNATETDSKMVIKTERKVAPMNQLTSPILLATPMPSGSTGNAHIASPSIKILSTEAADGAVSASSSNTTTSDTLKPVEHTVNLLNNNRIIIKSVKSASSTTSPTKPNASDPEHTSNVKVKCHTDGEPKFSIADKLTNYSADSTQPSSSSTSVSASDERIKRVQCADASDNGVSSNHTDSDAKFNTIDTQHMFADTNAAGDSVGHEIKVSPKIGREFKQLQKDVSESKILTEFMMDQTPYRIRPVPVFKQKVADDGAAHVERVDSPALSESDRSASSAPGSTSGKRNTRSRNTDFSAKQQRFLRNIHQSGRGTDDESDNVGEDDEDDLDFQMEQERRKSVARPTTVQKHTWDKYCWKCHQLEPTLFCSTCVRSYHTNCVKIKQMTDSEMETWQCSECVELTTAEQENRKKKVDVRHFNKLLKYAMNRILQDPNLQQFQSPVNKARYPDYAELIIHPTNLSKIERDINNVEYASGEAFLMEIKWILHNCSIYFSDNTKVMRAAKALQKVCKQELTDIETCAECYLNANTMADNWFTEVCERPHLIIWAKLKGFPLWPAKAMSVNAQMVDVRFFGEHDRANLPAKDCFLYSREDPNPPTNKYKRNTIADCVKEVDVYIGNIITRFGSFKYAEIKTPFNPQTIDEHLQEMIPSLKGTQHNRHKAKSDLTLRIIKTGDNHLSVVKKGQSTKESSAPKRTVDITGDGAISRTPTPPKPPAPSARRATIDIRSKRYKSSNRADGILILNASDSMAYDMHRRQSVAVENMRSKKVPSSVAFKRRSIELSVDSKNFTAPAKTVARESATLSQPTPPPKPSTVANKLETSRPVGRPPLSQTARKRKALATPLKMMEAPAPLQPTPPKVKRVDDKLNDEVCENEANILRSVGLVKKIPESNAAIVSKRCSVSLSRLDAQKTSPSEHRDQAAPKGKKSQTQRSPFLHRPFIEIKEEPTSDNDGEVVVVQPLTHSTPLDAGQRKSKKSARDAHQRKVSSINNGGSSDDDDSLMIIEDDSLAKPIASRNSSVRSTESVRRGAISVRDLSKMTTMNSEASEKSADGKSRRAVPKNLANTSGVSILKPVNPNNTSLNVSNKPTPSANSIVRTPTDGIQGRDTSYSSTQPPPLSVVSKTSGIALLVKKQPAKETASTANGPPPLTINQSVDGHQVSISAVPTSTSTPTTPPSTTPNTIANGMLTEDLAAAVTDTLLGNLPSLTPRPTRPGAAQSYSSDAGPVSRTLMENAHKMTDFFRSVIEDTLADLSGAPNLEAKVRMLELDLERERSARAKEVTELKTNTDRLLAEMKKSMDRERTRMAQEIRKKCEVERIKSVEETKKKLWCAQCSKEALFYCCWNTSYCDHTCQKKHWESHIHTCQQLQQLQDSPHATPPQSQQSSTKPSTSKSTARPIQNAPSRPSVQKDPPTQPIIQSPLVQSLVQPNMRTAVGARIVGNALVPGLRSILPKNSVVPIVTTNQPLRQAAHVPSTKPSISAPQPCITIYNSVNSWPNNAAKSQSLLPNTIFLTQTPQVFANMQTASSSANVQASKGKTNDTIIIP